MIVACRSRPSPLKNRLACWAHADVPSACLNGLMVEERQKGGDAQVGPPLYPRHRTQVGQRDMSTFDIYCHQRKSIQPPLPAHRFLIFSSVGHTMPRCSCGWSESLAEAEVETLARYASTTRSIDNSLGGIFLH
jgi:hypothetical protein